MKEFLLSFWLVYVAGQVHEPNTLEQVFVCPNQVADRVLTANGEDGFLTRLHAERQCQRVGTSVTYTEQPEDVLIVPRESETHFVVRTPLAGMAIDT